MSLIPTIEIIIELINGLNDPQLNKHYESKLKVLTNQPGFGVVLAQIASDKKFDILYRQFSAILLKTYITQHWNEDGSEEDDEDDLEARLFPTATIEEKRTPTTEEKSQIKTLLSPCLSDPVSKIRTAIAMCIAKIGAYEWPHDWPGLVDELVVCLNNNNNTDLLNGAIRCLEILCDPNYLSDEQIQALINQVYPIYTELLLKDIDPMIHIRIINVFRATVTHIAFTKGMTQGLKNALFPFLPKWIPVFISHLSRVLDLTSPLINHYFTIMTGIIEIFILLIQDFPKKTTPFIQEILSPVWTLFNSCYPIYEKCEINPVHGIVSNFVEEGITKVDRLVSSIFDFMLQIVNRKELAPMFKPFLQPIFLNSIYYMQMGWELYELWSSDSNLFLESEDDQSYTPRVVATSLVQTMCEVYKSDGSNSLFEVISQILVKAQSEKTANNKNWWKLREAALIALCDSSERLAKLKQFNATSFLSGNLIQDFQGSSNDQGLLILRGRSLICASKFSKLVEPSISLQFFIQSVNLLNQEDAPASLKISSIIAIGSFASKISRESILQYIPTTVQALISMISDCSEDSLLMVLECIKLLIKIDKDITGSLEPIITLHISQAWVNYSSDPLLCEVMKEIFQVVCACPKSYPGVLQRMIPTLNIILCAYENPIYIAISDSAIDILSLLMARVDQQIDSFCLDQLFSPILNILLFCPVEKRSLIKASLNCLLPFIHKTPSDLLLNWKFVPSEKVTSNTTTPGAAADQTINGLHSLFLVIERIFTKTDDLIMVEIPPIINSLLIKHSDIINSQLPVVFNMVLQAFYAAKIPNLKQAFSSIFARLFIQHKTTIIDYLISLPGPTNKLASSSGKGFANALVFVLNEWQKYHFDLRSKLDNNVSVVAMCTLILLNDSRLESILVDGELIIPDKSTRTVRSKSKPVEPEKWTTVSLYSKIISNLMETAKYEKEELARNTPSTANQQEESSDEDADIIDPNKLESDDDDEEEESEEEDASAATRYGNVDKNGFAPAEDYSDMLEYADDGDDGEFNDEFTEDTFDIISKSDPIYHINVLAYLGECFANIKANRPDQFFPIFQEYRVKYFDYGN